MLLIAAFIVLVLLGLSYPRVLTYLIVVPFLGAAVGGLGWSIGAMLVPGLLSLSAFAWFLIGGIVTAGGVAIMEDVHGNQR